MEICKLYRIYSCFYSPLFHYAYKFVWTTMFPGYQEMSEKGQCVTLTDRMPTGYEARDSSSFLTLWKLGFKLFLI